MVASTICAGLNTLLNTVALAYLMQTGHDEDAKKLALLFAGFAVITRLLINNTFFFRTEMANYRHVLSRHAKKYVVVSLTLVSIVFFYAAGSRHMMIPAIYDVATLAIVVVVMLATHGVNVLVRQRLLLVGRALFLTGIHFFELVALGAALVLGRPELGAVVFVYFTLRSIRVYVMAREL